MSDNSSSLLHPVTPVISMPPKNPELIQGYQDGYNPRRRHVRGNVDAAVPKYYYDKFMRDARAKLRNLNNAFALMHRDHARGKELYDIAWDELRILVNTPVQGFTLKRFTPVIADGFVVRIKVEGVYGGGNNHSSDSSSMGVIPPPPDPGP